MGMKHTRKLEIPVVRIVSVCFGANKFVSKETFNVSKEHGLKFCFVLVETTLRIRCSLS